MEINFSILKYSRLILEPSKLLIEVIEKLVSLKPRGKKERFDLIIQPMHKQFEEVHRDYAQMFRNLKDSLPVKYDNNLYKISGKVRKYKHKSALAKSRKMIEDFDYKRAVKIGLRDWLRHSAQGIVSELKNKKERQYFYSIFVYFLDDEFVENPSKELIECTMKTLQERGGGAIFNTPSSIVIMNLDKLKTVEEMHDYLDAEIHALGLRCSNVIKSYMAMM
ncbi:MAG: hypothetical protein COA69_03435 [Robiginitomaculum sp.]|nr:MAG: hypothetical protein COA69_03435 [Robiginitomaculum sp.]